jgi:hypothetical protein
MQNMQLSGKLETARGKGGKGEKYNPPLQLKYGITAMPAA